MINTVTGLTFLATVLFQEFSFGRAWRQLVETQKLLPEWLNILKVGYEHIKYCANCKRDATGFDEKLKQCKSCKAVWYCGRECQLQHWKKGHKIDSIKQK